METTYDMLISSPG